MRKIATPIFLEEKPSNETTTTTFNISGIQAQHDQVAMAMHGVSTETRYIHIHVLVHVPKKRNSNFMYMYINGNTYYCYRNASSGGKFTKSSLNRDRFLQQHSLIANKYVRRICNQVL